MPVDEDSKNWKTPFDPVIIFLGFKNGFARDYGSIFIDIFS